MTTVGRWRLGKLLGRGYHGETYEATDTSGEISTAIAMKLVPVSGEADREAVRQEVNQLWEVSHHHVIAVRAEPREIELDGREYVAFGVELCDATLLDVASWTDDRDALLRWAVPQIIEGLKYLHDDAGRIHRDLHAGNIFLRGFTWKIGDLGLVRTTERLAAAPEIVGARELLAPEVASGAPASRDSDTFALGVLVHHMLTGRYVFDPSSSLEEVASGDVHLDASLPAEWRPFVEAATVRHAPRCREDELLGLVPRCIPDFRSADIVGPESGATVRFDRDRLVGAYAYKLSAAGHHHRIELYEDGTLVESPIFHPSEWWEGIWEVGPTGALVIRVGDHELRVSTLWRRGWPVFAGVESHVGTGEECEFRLVLADRGSREHPPGVLLKVSEAGRVWAARLSEELTPGGGRVTEVALFEPETSFGAWYQFTDALGLPHLCLRLGVFALDALPVAHEWHGVEVAGADDTTSDEVRANFVLVALGSVRSSTLPVADVDESLEEAVERFCFEQGISWDEAGVELAAEIEAALAKDELIQRDALDAGSASFDRRLDSSYRSAVEDLSDRFREAGDLLGDDRLLDSLRGHQLPRIRARARLAWQACCPMSDLIGPDREDLYLEYKPTLRWGVSRGEGRVLKDREDAVVKTIAAFANGEFGGTLLIGVADEGTVLGLSDDYETFAGHGSRDAFTQHLFNLLQRDVGVAAAALVGVDFERFDDLDVCRVHVAPSAEPVFAGGERQRFFWRLGPATIDVKDGVERQRIIERRFRGWR